VSNLICRIFKSVIVLRRTMNCFHWSNMVFMIMPFLITF